MSDTPDDKTPAQPIDDDLIMPYADGVLAPDQRPAVRDALATGPRADAEVRKLPLHPRTACARLR